MTIDDAWAYGRSKLHHSPTPVLDARLLLEHCTGMSHAQLVAYGKQPLTDEQLSHYKSFILRASQQEPIPYILGSAPFFDFELTVTPDVLIPRPETEQLVELVLAWLRGRKRPSLVDVGTGSGCIPIAIARKCVDCEITAVDVSPSTLAIAQQNAHRLAPNRIQFVQADLLGATGGPFDLIVANLPYVTAGEWTQLADGVKLHEPALALIGGRDGLDLIRRLLQQAQTRLNRRGAIFLEIGWQQGTAVRQLAQIAFPNATVDIVTDFAGHGRFATITHDKAKNSQQLTVNVKTNLTFD